MKRLSLLILAGIVVAGAAFLAERKLRLGRDLIFHSADVQGFLLPNGKAVRTKKWYEQSDLLDAGQEFYTGGNGLAIMVPEEDVSLGFATITDEGCAVKYLQVPKQCTTVLSMSTDSVPAEKGVVKELKTKGYNEWWVCRQEAGVQQ